MKGTQHNFAQVPQADIPRSTFNRSFNYKTTLNAGGLIPVFVDEMVPGDTFNLRMSMFARLSTPIVPIMDNIYMDTFFFFCPTRLLWDNWEKFNGAQDDPGDSTDFLVPQITAPSSGGGWTSGSLGDYFGIPTGINSLSTNALPFRAYGLIWNEWFRDQNIIGKVTIPMGDGPDPATSYYGILSRGKRHDYFTSALPWPQKGPAVTIPLGTEAPVLRESNAAAWKAFNAGSNTNSAAGDIQYNGAFLDNTISTVSLDPNGGLYADLSSATAATINALRQAFQIQKMYERDARGGTRYIEVIKAHFGVTSPDARLQRPEYLGGGSFPVNITPVPQTSATGGTGTPQGNLSGFGTVSVSKGAGFTYSATEHGYIIGLVSARADLNYQQGLERMWSRRTRFDFYWPALSHIGEQAVLNKEIYCQGTSADDDVFGYQERYAEYRYKPNMITGDFRSTAAQSLDIWHLAQEFLSLPSLNAAFITENPPMSRVLAVPTAPQFLFDAHFSYRCARPMPVYSVPGLIDHF